MHKYMRDEEKEEENKEETENESRKEGPIKKEGKTKSMTGRLEKSCSDIADRDFQDKINVSKKAVVMNTKIVTPS